METLEQVGDLDVRVAIINVAATSERLPKMASASSKNWRDVARFCG